ncbi:MAG: hypothetical protein ACRDTC_03890 [Pseudonocardiaceae bacterium]
MESTQAAETSGVAVTDDMSDVEFESMPDSYLAEAGSWVQIS